MNKKNQLILGALFIFMMINFLLIRKQNLFGDEYPHLQQIEVFMKGELRIVKGLSKLPGYHLAIALMGRILDVRKISSFRALSFILFLLTIAMFYKLTKLVDRESSLTKTLQYALLPIRFPFVFLLYSEGLSNLLLFLLFYLVMKKKYYLAGLFGLLSVFIRQTNIVFLAMFLILGYVEEYRFDINGTKIMTYLAKTWVFLLVFILFVVFVYLNKGVAVRDQEAMPSFQIHAGGVYWGIFLIFILFLPLHLANIRKIAQKIAAKMLIIIPLLLFIVVGIITFDNLHPQNKHWEHLTNRVLLLYTGVVWKRAAFFIFISISLLSLSVTSLLKKSYYLLYPFAILSVMPFWLIDSRYSLPAITLFILMRKRESRLVEYSIILLFLIMWLVFFVGFIRRDYYL